MQHPSTWGGRATGRVAALGIFVTVALSCACSGSVAPRPNVLWIVWDTARADHLGLYGHERDTTPFLDEWAKGARVFDNCLSTAGYTLPSHAAMFTGLLPSENCANNEHKSLDESYTTIAELLQGAGYRTYLFSANPNISEGRNFTQGFDVAEHPWNDEFHDRAIELVRSKLPEYDNSSELRERLDDVSAGAVGLTPWNIKAAGELAGGAAMAWLEASEPDKPFFVFINYMEAHRPYIPPRSFREQLMTPQQVDDSYQVDRGWLKMWEYTFGLREYDDEEIELTRATYDAALLELDSMLEELLGELGRRGQLEDTIVILTSDHGEHLGEQHMLDHQYSVYQALLRVPLIVHYPERFAPGREDRPVMNFDLFPTLIELTGIDAPDDQQSQARSLLDPPQQRRRLAEDPAFSPLGVRIVSQLHHDWDATPWKRIQRTLIEGTDKFIWGSDGRTELYDLAGDPNETRDLTPERPARAAEMQLALAQYYDSLQHCSEPAEEIEVLSPEQLELLRSIGYVE